MSTEKRTPIAEDENFVYYEHIVRRGEDIASIADDYGTTWEYISQCNELQPPYPLAKGAMIEVPVLHSVASTTTSQTTAPVEQSEVVEEKRDQLGMFAQFFSKKEQAGSEAVEAPLGATPGQTVEPGTELDWMQSDEEQYHEAMRAEEQALSRRANTIIAGLVLFFGGLIGFYIYNLTQQPDQGETVSINELAGDAPQEEERDDNATPETPTEEQADDGAENTDTTEADTATEETAADVVPSEVSIQVLNGGAAAGQATTLTNTLRTAGYTMSTATNAANAIEGVKLYYGTDEHKADAETAQKSIGATYGEVIVEQNADLVKRVGTDLVIILGS